jgi:hypothetical protein
MRWRKKRRSFPGGPSRESRSRVETRPADPLPLIGGRSLDVTRTTFAVLFIGPVVLAVSYTLLEVWVLGGEPAEEAAAVPEIKE